MHFRRRRRRRKRSAGRASSTSAIGLEHILSSPIVPSFLPLFARRDAFLPRSRSSSRSALLAWWILRKSRASDETSRERGASRQIYHRVDGMSDSRIAFPSATSKFPRSDPRREIFFGQRMADIGRQSQRGVTVLSSVPRSGSTRGSSSSILEGCGRSQCAAAGRGRIDERDSRSDRKPVRL